MNQTADVPTGANGHTRATSVVDLRLWVGSTPWRLAPVWTFLAGLILSGTWSWSPSHLAKVMLALLLVEALWGAIWGQMLALAQLPARGPGANGVTKIPPWPYAASDAPLARLWHWAQASDEGPLTRDVWIVFLLAGAAAVMLGTAAVFATVLVMLIALAATAFAPAYPRLTRLLAAVVAVALPWWLGMALFAAPQPIAWPAPSTGTVWLLMAAFTLLAFAAEELTAGGSAVWQWAGSAAVVAVLVIAQERAAAAAMAAALVVPSVRAGSADPERLGRWHLLALAIAVALLSVG